MQRLRPTIKGIAIKGRPPKPREVRIAEGNPGKRPLPLAVVGLGKVLDVPEPDHFSEQELQVWRALVPEMSQLGWIDQADVPQLVVYVRTFALVERLGDELAQGPLTYSSKKKGRVGNPNVRGYLSAVATLNRLAETFGVTPAARTRLGLMNVQGLTLAAELENRMGEDIEIPDVIEID